MYLHVFVLTQMSSMTLTINLWPQYLIISWT